MPNSDRASADALAQDNGFRARCSPFGEIRKAIHKKLLRPVTAVVPVHLYGQMAEMDPILELADRYNLTVIEDACQAHGAEYFSNKQNRWLKAGSVGRAAAFSFYPGKNLGACGEGGAVTTNDEQIASRIHMLRDHGQPKKYYHDLEGYNGRLDAIQAGILAVKLEHLFEWNQKRREAASRYEKLLSSVEELTLPFEPAWAKSIFHLYVVAAAERNELLEHLRTENIGHGIHYPVPVHLQKPYQNLGYRENDFPVAEQASRNLLSLPIHPYLTGEEQARVAQAIAGFYGAIRPSVVLNSAR
ncbi:MAG: hypothetical protein DMG32_02500 [Acidobacteria bacterium]|nr:MAG: hypothetical protein DMG32_02500 [Acidobacteriota bacterium]